MHERIVRRHYNRPRQRPQAPYTYAWLIVRTEDGWGAQAQLHPDCALILGREPGCDLVFTDLRVSRRHAIVRYEAGWYVIHDLGSLYGVHVNNRRVQAKRLRHNDLIELGDTRLVFIAG